MSKEAPSRVAVLTVAGSDSGGGAGIQADLKTFEALGVFGTSAITCLTAQNPRQVSGVRAVDPEFVSEQIARVCEAFPVAAVKTGMLYSAEIIAAVAASLRGHRLRNLVADPVMVAASGAPLLRPDAMALLRERLLPLARVVTPNMHEAEILAGRRIRTEADLVAAAESIRDALGVPCVAKGGHLEGPDVVDVLADERGCAVFRGRRVEGVETHGAGCTFSAALAAGLAVGLTLAGAVEQARDFVAAAMANAPACGTHRPLDFSWHVRPRGTPGTDG